MDENLFFYLDEVLRWLTMPSKDWIKTPIAVRSRLTRDEAFMFSLNDFPNLNIREFKEDKEYILDKLVKDGYVGKERPPNTGIEYYFGTYEGRIFNKRGGYKSQYHNAVQNEKRIIRNDKTLAAATVAAAVGAFFLFGMEVIKFFASIKHTH